MAKRKFYIGIDLGGTKLLVALFDKRFRLLAEEKSRVEIQKGESGFLKTLISGIKKVLEEANEDLDTVLAVGLGCPGMIDAPNGIVQLSPNIPFLKKYPLAKILKKHLKISVILENDVNAGLYGEQQFGAAKGSDHVVGIFLGTGVGGALILNGKLYRGVSGAAGEIGHVFMNLPNEMSDSMRATTLESLTGRLKIASDAALLLLKDQSRQLYKEVDFDIKKIKSGTLYRAISNGDKRLKELLIQKARILGVAMANTVNLLNPELIVLGGGMVEACGKWLLPEATRVMKHYAMAPIVKDVHVVPAKLQDHAIVYGAAKLAADYLEEKDK